jgi:hypothetical protein
LPALIGGKRACTSCKNSSSFRTLALVDSFFPLTRSRKPQPQRQEMKNFPSLLTITLFDVRNEDKSQDYKSRQEQIASLQFSLDLFQERKLTNNFREKYPRLGGD